MNHTKMLELANFMENLEAERFNMGYWVSYFDYDEDNQKNIYQENEVLDINDCNTAGCIAGWTVALEYGGAFNIDEHIYQDSNDYYDFGVKDSARNILNLKQSEADRLFLFSSESVWFDYRKDYDLTEFYEYRNDENVLYAIDEEEIKPKHVADMLRRIVSGEVKL
jgi:hypothetical protein